MCVCVYTVCVCVCVEIHKLRAKQCAFLYQLIVYTKPMYLQDIALVTKETKVERAQPISTTIHRASAMIAQKMANYMHKLYAS